MISHPLCSPQISRHVVIVFAELMSTMLNNRIWQDVLIAPPRPKRKVVDIMRHITMVDKVPSPDLVLFIQMVEDRVVPLIASCNGRESKVLNERSKSIILSPWLGRRGC